VPIHRMKWRGLLVMSLLSLSWMQLCAQKQAAGGISKASPDYSGMYSFLREGEFVQISVEAGRVTGFVSRYADTENDEGEFLEHFFKQAKLEGSQLTFTTEAVHGLSYEFHGEFERGEGKNPGDESYYVLNGTLTENIVNGDKKSSQASDVNLKRFPQDLAPTQAEKK
jgi:hypothetical protein